MVITDLIDFEFKPSCINKVQPKKKVNKMNQLGKVGIEMSVIGKKFGIEKRAVHTNFKRLEGVEYKLLQWILEIFKMK